MARNDTDWLALLEDQELKDMSARATKFARNTNGKTEIIRQDEDMTTLKEEMNNEAENIKHALNGGCIAIDPVSAQDQELIRKIQEEHGKKYSNSSGGSTSYYKLHIEDGVTFGDYDCECQDIIEAFDMSFNEGNIFKSLWRLAAARAGNPKAGYDGGKRDAEKILYAAQRLMASYDREGDE